MHFYDVILQWVYERKNILFLFFFFTLFSINTQAKIINSIASITRAEGYMRDYGTATSAEIFYPDNIATNAKGNLYIVDRENNRIRKWILTVSLVPLQKMELMVIQETVAMLLL